MAGAWQRTANRQRVYQAFGIRAVLGRYRGGRWLATCICRGVCWRGKRRVISAFCLRCPGAALAVTRRKALAFLPLLPDICLHPLCSVLLACWPLLGLLKRCLALLPLSALCAALLSSVLQRGGKQERWTCGSIRGAGEAEKLAAEPSSTSAAAAYHLRRTATTRIVNLRRVRRGARPVAAWRLLSYPRLYLSISRSTCCCSCAE